MEFRKRLRLTFYCFGSVGLASLPECYNYKLDMLSPKLSIELDYFILFGS